MTKSETWTRHFAPFKTNFVLRTVAHDCLLGRPSEVSSRLLECQCTGRVVLDALLYPNPIRRSHVAVVRRNHGRNHYLTSMCMLNETTRHKVHMSSLSEPTMGAQWSVPGRGNEPTPLVQERPKNAGVAPRPFACP